MRLFCRYRNCVRALLGLLFARTVRSVSERIARSFSFSSRSLHSAFVLGGFFAYFLCFVSLVASNSLAHTLCYAGEVHTSLLQAPPCNRFSLSVLLLVLCSSQRTKRKKQRRTKTERLKKEKGTQRNEGGQLCQQWPKENRQSELDHGLPRQTARKGVLAVILISIL